MKKYIYFLFLTCIAVTVAQQKDTQLTRRQQKLMGIQEGTTYSSADAERILQQQEDGWKFCKAGAIAGLTTAIAWAADNKECCACCGYTAWILCSVGCMAICDCDC